MEKFNFEDYRQPWETGPHWELKKEFIEKYEQMFEEDRLLCLAQAYANVVLMNCCYPDAVMRQISELSKPLQMRKKFQAVNSNTETAMAKNEQSKEKTKSVYEQTGRPFKQIKFCASQEQHNATFVLDSVNLPQSSTNHFNNSSSLPVPNLQDDLSLSQKSKNTNIDATTKCLPMFNQQSIDSLSPNSTVPYCDIAVEVQPVFNQQSTESSKNSNVPSCDITGEIQPFLQTEDNISPEKEKNERIISILGLSSIQKFSYMMKKFEGKIKEPVGAILCVLEKMKLSKDCKFEISSDSNSPKKAILFNSKFFIKKFEIASATACNKKEAKKLCAEAAINTLFNLSSAHALSCEEVLQLFSKNIVHRSRKQPALVSLKNLASSLHMDNFIAFDVTSRNISPSETEYSCNFVLKGILISNGKDSVSDDAINKAADLGFMKLLKLHEYEIVNGELKKKNDDTTDKSLHSSDLSLSKLPLSMDTCFAKPIFILNQGMYNLSLRDNFVLVIKENNEDKLQNNPKSIYHESVSFNHKKYECQFEDVQGKNAPSIKAALLIDDTIVGIGIGTTKDEAKTNACFSALNDLKKKYYTLKIKEEYVEGFIITRNQVFEGESYSSNVISESNVGCKMLKSMGWTGGGLGGKGIAEPIQATSQLSFGRGLGFEGSQGGESTKLFKKRLGAMLQEFCQSENYSDLVFSKDFTKEERKQIHQFAGRLHLHTVSRGVGSERFLIIRQKYETRKLLTFLAKNGGSNSKFELIDNSGTL